MLGLTPKNKNSLSDATDFISTEFAKEDFAKIDAEWAVDALQGGVLEIN